MKANEGIDWRDLSKKYKGLWVALDEKEKKVISSGKTAKKVYNEAKKKGVGIPILYRVPSVSGIYIGGV